MIVLDDKNYVELLTDVREQLTYFRELGVESIDAELPEYVAETSAASAAAVAAKRHDAEPAEPVERYVPKEPILPQAKKTETAKRSSGSRLAALPSLAKRPLKNVTDQPVIKNDEEADSEILFSAAPLSTEDMKEAAAQPAEDVIPKAKERETIEIIREEIGDCTRCPLHAGRTQVVHSTGNFNAQLMFVGEAPGADEDEKGEPFVGRAGQLLTRIIESIGIKREDVFIGNINRCRPPGNRAPVPEETAACRPYLLREIDVIKPKVIVVLGATAAHNLLQVKTPISKLRGSFHEYFGVKVMPTFHPAYLLRDPHKKREVWEDMKKVRDQLNNGAGE